ncbi:MAG: hypothetical protein LQ348_007358 [Seirophora lacunosa]|nr:MAG: hypothetical protein LQ344_003079 [Seirophora lacunosa]KAI4169066.1 MAG: hypothetical protein LQ348_007358 [Seirophora lacunosa]
MDTAQQPSAAGLDQTCPSCGADITNLLQKLAERTQSRVSELETQVRILTDKATAAVDKLADYEDQLHQLKASSSQPRPSSCDPSTLPNSHSPEPRPPSATGTQRSAFQTRLSNLLPTNRRSVSQPPSSAPPTKLSHSQSIHHPAPLQNHESGHHHTSSNPTFPSGDPHDLQSALQEERTLRHALEARLSDSTTELEELSTQLFSEANELVAKERRSLHSLQQQYNTLQSEAKEWEKKATESEREEERLKERLSEIEGREKGKGKRWEELEMRVRRVERVKGLLSGEDGVERRAVSASVVEGKGMADNLDGAAESG